MANRSFSPLDPFGIARSLRGEIDRLIDGALIRPAGWLANWEPGKGILPLDVHAEGENLIVRAAMPGLKSGEVRVEIDGNVLTIVGESKLDQESKEHSHHLRDHLYVRLERSVALPMAIDTNKAEAVFADGVLTVTLPHSKETQTSQIAIKAAAKAQKPEPVASQVSTETPEPQPVPVQVAEPEAAAAQAFAAQAPEPQPIAVEPVAAQAPDPKPLATEPVAAQAPEPIAVEPVVDQPAAVQVAEPEPNAAEPVAAQAHEPQPAATPADEPKKVGHHKARRQRREAAKAEPEKVA